MFISLVTGRTGYGHDLAACWLRTGSMVVILDRDLAAYWLKTGFTVTAWVATMSLKLIYF